MSDGRARGLLAPVVVAAVGLVSSAALPFFALRPNRIAMGKSVYLATSAPLALALLAVSWAAYAYASFGRGRARSIVGAATPVAVAATALISAAFLGLSLAGADKVARLALGPGFWLSGALAYIAYVMLSRERNFGRGVDIVAASTIVALTVILIATGALAPVAVFREWNAQRSVFAAELGRHVVLSGVALFAGSMIGGVFGAVASRRKALREGGFFILGALQTIPSLALFGILILPLAALAQRYPVLREWGIGGIGPAPALIALTLYATFPIARNTCVALRGVSSAALDAGLGMGMSKTRLFFTVELPLALPVSLAGLRTAAVQTVGNAAVAALIGAGGLGIFIFQGLGQFAMDMVLLGTLPLIVLALAVDAAFGSLARLASAWTRRPGAAAQARA
jgi:osmoprotectant transport system permease protein